MYTHAFKFCDGFSDMVSCSFNLTIAISRLPMKKNRYQLLGAKNLTNIQQWGRHTFLGAKTIDPLLCMGAGMMISNDS
jgi:hypothetical protein